MLPLLMDDFVLFPSFTPEISHDRHGNLKQKAKSTTLSGTASTAHPRNPSYTAPRSATSAPDERRRGSLIVSRPARCAEENKLSRAISPASSPGRLERGRRARPPQVYYPPSPPPTPRIQRLPTPDFDLEDRAGPQKCLDLCGCCPTDGETRDSGLHVYEEGRLRMNRRLADARQYIAQSTTGHRIRR
ncbi:uncharacterized protein B0I36DRAFT_137097 [Microdochium trichocladiopsis]|uniref:Uncharacterized protein n=1 Tax=Microdochium trichocladiopsis TaxID=1682393 RepID=A0A9P8Y1Q4_9PEZI|nr:uncharacterized protein B0I36DRAFT_137097 [Microdochium trichocladiopsis]KAH7027288.1 hypothetical protein B0I36DRAFT_137097 [Microdochium trichocladiopsis]